MQLLCDEFKGIVYCAEPFHGSLLALKTLIKSYEPLSCQNKSAIITSIDVAQEPLGQLLKTGGAITERGVILAFGEEILSEAQKASLTVSAASKKYHISELNIDSRKHGLKTSIQVPVLSSHFLSSLDIAVEDKKIAYYTNNQYVLPRDHGLLESIDNYFARCQKLVFDENPEYAYRLSKATFTHCLLYSLWKCTD